MMRANEETVKRPTGFQTHNLPHSKRVRQSIEPPMQLWVVCQKTQHYPLTSLREFMEGKNIRGS